MRAVFADAFYFVGLLNREDQHHARVVAAAKGLHEDVVTTEWILAEKQVHNGLRQVQS